MPAATSGTKSLFYINTNQLFNFYHSAAPTTHICVYFSAATPATASTAADAFHQHNYSTNHHLHAKLRILLQHLTSHAAYERRGGPAAKRPCIYIMIAVSTAVPVRRRIRSEYVCTRLKSSLMKRQSGLEAQCVPYVYAPSTYVCS